MLRGIPPAAPAERVSQVLATLGLEAIADRRTAGFSQRERMKTALGRAILHAPKNVLLDEPPNGLDGGVLHFLRTGGRSGRSSPGCWVSANTDDIAARLVAQLIRLTPDEFPNHQPQY